MSCYNCKNRELYCHSKCEDYKAYREKADMAKQNRFKETGFESYLYDARKTMQDKRGVMRL